MHLGVFWTAQQVKRCGMRITFVQINGLQPCVDWRVDVFLLRIKYATRLLKKCRLTSCFFHFVLLCCSFVLGHAQVIEDSFYFGVQVEAADDAQSFPTTYAFSATVPEIGRALLRVRARPYALVRLILRWFGFSIGCHRILIHLKRDNTAPTTSSGDPVTACVNPSSLR